MAHYAVLDSENFVVNVFVGRDEDDLAEGVTDWEQYYAPEGYTVKRTSYNTHGGVHYTINEEGLSSPSSDQSKGFRKNFAQVGGYYDEVLDAFIPLKPYESWVLNQETCLWEAPVTYPEDGAVYDWDEESGSWVVAPEATVE